jgi:FeS assembly SUF system protein
MTDPAATESALNGGESDPLTEKVIEALKTVYDPEIPVNIYDLGLIYDLRIKDGGVVDLDMTLTAPGCPVAEHFPTWVEDAVKTVEGISEAHVELVWDPPWSPERMSEEAKLELGFM